MYKVLLVDDEPMALECLKYIVDWAKLGFEVCGTCCNGKEATDAIDTYKPDVIITDIKMPVMDGIDLIRYAREDGKESIKFIVVSGYGEFEYAKKAMRYGIRYYLQKPILQDEINETIIEVTKQLEKIHGNKESEEIDRKAIFDGVLMQLLQGSDKQGALMYLRKFMDEDAFSACWNCIVLELEVSDQVNIDVDLKKTRFKIRNIINKVVVANSEVFVLEHGTNTFIILASIKNEGLNSIKINCMAENIYKNIVLEVSIQFTITVGESVFGINDVKHSYTTAVTALVHRFYMGFNCLIFYNDIKDKKFKIEFNDLFMSSKVIEAVEELECSKIKNIIDTTFEYFKEHRIDPDIVIMFTSNMVCKISNLIYQSNNKARGFIDNHSVRELKGQERTIQELKSFFERFCLECCEHLKKARHNNSESNIAKIEIFIKENYKRNITIRELAENIYMHPAYLGQLFIQKFGICFNEYIHKLRIEEAKRLIKVSSLKNHEIAEELGYSNYNSFLLKFQKYTGMKPTEFRNSVYQ